jgi:hypothetical protein
MTLYVIQVIIALNVKVKKLILTTNIRLNFSGFN